MDKIVCLGTRGTIPHSVTPASKYGTDSSCYLVCLAEEKIILDAGTGILAAEAYFEDEEEINILISHFHLDHVMGLLAFAPMFNKSHTVNIYSKRREGFTLKELFYRLLSLPLWPITMEDIANVNMFEITDNSFGIGDVEICVTEGNHKNGCDIFKLIGNGKSVVYTGDFEQSKASTARLIDFAKGADAMIYDAMYDSDEYLNKVNWGHSTWEEGTKTAEAAGIKNLLLTHHAPQKSDKLLDIIDENLKSINAGYILARKGTEVIL